MPSIPADSLDSLAAYKLLVGSVQPRPIALVSSIDNNGRTNLAPFSFFSVASVYPPVLSFTTLMMPVPGESRGIAKHTLENVRDTGECVIHIISHGQAAKMNETAAPWPRGISEFDAAGWTAIPSDLVAVPRASEAPIAFECVLEQIVSFGEYPRSGSLVLARVVMVHVADDVYQEGRIELRALDSIARLAGPVYCRSTEGLFEMPTPGIDHVKKRMEEESWS